MKWHPRLPVAVLPCLLVSSFAAAQQPDAGEIQRLMEQAAQLQQGAPMPDIGDIGQLQQRALEMQDCLAKVDQSVMEQLRVEGEAVGVEIKSLCKAGQRDAAQARAIAYSQRIAATPEMAELTQCGSMLTAMLPAAVATTPDEAAATAPSHVCDVAMEQ